MIYIYKTNHRCKSYQITWISSRNPTSVGRTYPDRRMCFRTQACRPLSMTTTMMTTTTMMMDGLPWRDPARRRPPRSKGAARPTKPSCLCPWSPQGGCPTPYATPARERVTRRIHRLRTSCSYGKTACTSASMGRQIEPLGGRWRYSRPRRELQPRWSGGGRVEARIIRTELTWG